MPSFDIVSKVDMQEVKNAVDQVRRELSTRYDLKGSKCSVELNDSLIVLLADDNMKLKAVQEIIKLKLSKRGVSLLSVTFADAQSAGGDMIRQEITVKQGLSDDERKKINKMIKSTKFKVTPQIQADQIRVSSKSRDELQEVIGFLKREIKDLDLQFTNFRD